MKLKRLVSLALAVVMIASLAACGQSGSSTSSQSTPVASVQSQDKEIKTLTMLTFTEWYKTGWQALEKYINDHSQELGFKLDIQKIAGGSQGEDILKVKFATDDLPDLLQSYGSSWLDKQANSINKMVDLTGISSVSQYDAAVLQEGGYLYNSKLYGMPVDTTNLLGVFYNKKVFKEAGIEKVPSNWNEFLDACEKVKKVNKVPLYYSGKDAWTLQCFAHFGFNEEVLKSGKDFTDFWKEMNTNKRHYADNKDFLGAIERSKEMVDKKYVNPTYLSDTYDMAQTALAKGDAAMYVNATWVIDEISSKYPDAVNDIGAFPLPLYDKDNYTSSSLPSSIGMTTKCKDMELGKKAIDFISSDTAQQIYANAQTGIYLNKNVKVKLAPAQQDLDDVMKAGKSMPLWQGSGNEYGYGTFDKYVQDYYVGSRTADDVLKALDEETAKNAKAANDTNWK